MELLRIPPSRYDLIEVHMHLADWHLYDRWCKSNEFYRGVPTFKGSRVTTMERWTNIPEGKVYFARGCLCRDANLEWIEETEFLNQV